MMDGHFQRRLLEVKERVAAAAARGGRRLQDIRLIAVSKYATVPQVVAAYRAGQRDFAENYVKPGIDKIEAVAQALGQQGAGATHGSKTLRWHMIGALQSNKAAHAARHFDLIHTLASARAARAISNAQHAEICAVLIQIHLGGDGRAGVPRERVEEFLHEICALPGLRVDGVMGVAPLGEDARPHFSSLRRVRDRLRALGLANAPMSQISAGMSGDFEAAVEEGATLVRLGSALFDSSQSQQ